MSKKIISEGPKLRAALKTAKGIAPFAALHAAAGATLGAYSPMGAAAGAAVATGVLGALAHKDLKREYKGNLADEKRNEKIKGFYGRDFDKNYGKKSRYNKEDQDMNDRLSLIIEAAIEDNPLAMKKIITEMLEDELNNRLAEMRREIAETMFGYEVVREDGGEGDEDDEDDVASDDDEDVVEDADEDDEDVEVEDPDYDETFSDDEYGDDDDEDDEGDYDDEEDA